MKKAARKIFFFCILLSASFIRGQNFAEFSQDTLAKESTVPDSIIANALRIKPFKPVLFFKSERRFKIQFSRLAFMASGHYLDYYQPTEELYKDVDRLSDRSRKKMLHLALGGGAALGALKYSRKYLRKYKNVFFANLTGLNFYYRSLPLSSQMLFRVSGLNDTYFIAYLNRSQFMLTRRQTQYYKQNGLFFKFYKNFRLMGLQTTSKYSTYNAIGLSQYSRNLNFYFVYQKNESRARAYIQWELLF